MFFAASRGRVTFANVQKDGPASTVTKTSTNVPRHITRDSVITASVKIRPGITNVIVALDLVAMTVAMTLMNAFQRLAKTTALVSTKLILTNAHVPMDLKVLLFL